MQATSRVEVELIGRDRVWNRTGRRASPASAPSGSGTGRPGRPGGAVPAAASTALVGDDGHLPAAWPIMRDIVEALAPRRWWPNKPASAACPTRLKRCRVGATPSGRWLRPGWRQRCTTDPGPCPSHVDRRPQPRCRLPGVRRSGRRRGPARGCGRGGLVHRGIRRARRAVAEHDDGPTPHGGTRLSFRAGDGCVAVRLAPGDTPHTCAPFVAATPVGDCHRNS